VAEIFFSAIVGENVLEPMQMGWRTFPWILHTYAYPQGMQNVEGQLFIFYFFHYTYIHIHIYTLIYAYLQGAQDIGVQLLMES
jgi:hypothetical protein